MALVTDMPNEVDISSFDWGFEKVRSIFSKCIVPFHIISLLFVTLPRILLYTVLQGVVLKERDPLRVQNLWLLVLLVKFR